MEKVILFKNSDAPQVIESDLELESLQKLVDGLIEVVDYEDNLILICNEEAKLLNMDPTFVIGCEGMLEPVDIICGPVVIAASKGDEIVGLTDEQIKECLSKF